LTSRARSAGHCRCAAPTSSRLTYFDGRERQLFDKVRGRWTLGLWIGVGLDHYSRQSESLRFDHRDRRLCCFYGITDEQRIHGNRAQRAGASARAFTHTSPATRQRQSFWTETTTPSDALGPRRYSALLHLAPPARESLT